MAGVNVFEPIANKFIQTSNSWSGVAGSLTAAVLAPITIGVSILIMWHGIAILRGAGGGNHALDVFVRSLRAFLVVALALAAGAYTSNIVAFLQDMRTQLTALFVTGSMTSYSALDIAMQKMLDTWDPVWNWSSANINFNPLNANISGIVAILCWGVMSACFWFFGAICAINLVLIDISLALMFALGPMFIACFAFQATARFTDAWLGAVLKYTLTAVVVAAITGLGVGILETYAQRIASASQNLQFVVAALAALGSSIVIGVLALRIPALAGDMVGGIGISAFGAGLGRLPIAAAQAVMTKGASVAANAGAYTTGRAAGSETGQKLINSTLGQKAIEAYTRTATTASAIGGSGGARAAYDTGLSRSMGGGTGTATGLRRPLGTTHTPGGGE